MKKDEAEQCCSARVMKENGERDTYADVAFYNRAFADFIFGSLILHFFCVNFIN